jgi:hypothetical protein
MMARDETYPDRTLLAIAILVVVLGLASTIFFLYIGQESYSSLYINPNSIVVNASHHDVFFIYGVKSSERSSTEYTLTVYSGNIPIKSNQFVLKEGEILEEGMNVVFPPGTTFPDKIALSLKTGTSEENVHIWVR